MTQQRFEERRRLARRRTLRRVLLAVVAVLAVAGLVWLVWFSSVLAVDRVQVQGAETFDASVVREAADVPAGRPLARVDTVAVESRVAALQRVERVDVSRSWPGTLRVEVVERSPVAWVLVDGRIRSLDRFGVDFRTLKKEPKELVEVRVGATDARQRQLALEGAAAVLSRLRTDAPALAEQVRRVEADTRDSILLVLSGRRTVLWGSAVRPEDKIRVLRPLLDIEAAEYDVSAPEQPTTRD